MIKRSVTFLLLATLFAFKPAPAQSGNAFLNAFKKTNADKTLTLQYIERDDTDLNIFISYLGNQNIGSYTGIYLNNLRLVDRSTGNTYYPSKTGGIPTESNGKFFMYNSGEKIGIVIEFEDIPLHVKYINLVEGDGDLSAIYNFTFKGMTLDASKDLYDSDEELDEVGDCYSAVFLTNENLVIYLYIDDVFVSKLENRFKDRSYTPGPGEYGTITVNYAQVNDHKIKAKASDDKKNYTWNFTKQLGNPWGYATTHRLN